MMVMVMVMVMMMMMMILNGCFVYSDVQRASRASREAATSVSASAATVMDTPTSVMMQDSVW